MNQEDKELLEFPDSLKTALTANGYEPTDFVYRLAVSAFAAGRRQGIFDTTGHPLRATGAQLIAFERQRQLDAEGWSGEHDDKHIGGELSAAAAAYTLLACDILAGTPYPQAALERLDTAWPWSQEWWKPSPTPIRNLVKSGALICAEIDRLQRKEKISGT